MPVVARRLLRAGKLLNDLATGPSSITPLWPASRGTSAVAAPRPAASSSIHPASSPSSAATRESASATPPSNTATSSHDRTQHQRPALLPPSLDQEHITSDGSLSTSPWRLRAPGVGAPAAPAPQQQQQQQAAAVRPPGLPRAAPSAPPISDAQLAALVALIQSSRNVVVLTGAGVSTEAGVPDYRGPAGAYTTGFKPMTHQQFMARAENRARYWARSFAGWHEFAHVQPSAAHDGIARLYSRHWLSAVLTQNVDRLHHKAGMPEAAVTELHGTTHRVVCMDCGAVSCRHELQARLAVLNPEAAAAAARRLREFNASASWQRALKAGTAADARHTTSSSSSASAGDDSGSADGGVEQVPVRRPDGDVELRDAGVGFRVLPCAACGDGVLKPDVVYFGDSVPPERAAAALAAASSADLLLVVGSSLMVWSAFRLVKAAKEAGAVVAIVNVGPTRADELADLKVEALAGEVMMKLATHPSLLLPRT